MYWAILFTFSQLSPMLTQLISKGMRSFWPLLPSPFFFFETGWNRFTASKWLVWSRVTRERVKPCFMVSSCCFFSCVIKVLVVDGVCETMKSEQQGTTNCKFMNNGSDYTSIIKANCLRDFALIIAIINTCFMFPWVFFNFISSILWNRSGLGLVHTFMGWHLWTWKVIDHTDVNRVISEFANWLFLL